jgi:hypothetical protein
MQSHLHDLNNVGWYTRQRLPSHVYEQFLSAGGGITHRTMLNRVTD